MLRSKDTLATMLMRILHIAAVLAAATVSGRARAQGGSLDVLDGETLYERGWLATVGRSWEQKDRLQHGKSAVSDPLNRRRTLQATTLAAHHGLRHDLQLSCLVPFVRKSERQRGALAAGTIRTAGLGDVVTSLKWRFWRWDAPGVALNCAMLGGIKTATGAAREREQGVRVEADLQPGTGSWDPLAGIAVTYEPNRWRFNSYVLYQHKTTGAGRYRHGDEIEVELAAGNRFWLLPYPGPFMRFDCFARARTEERARQSGQLVHDSGEEVVSLGGNLAFRPRPALDFQLEVETPVWQRLRGRQLAEELRVTFTAGVRF